MAKFDYQGNVEGLDQKHLDYISKVLNERGFKPGTVLVEQVGKLGDNYQATVKRFIIEDFRMVAKIAMSVEDFRDKMRTAQNFKNETAMYSKVLPKFAELLKEAGITDCLQIAQCYGCCTEEPYEVILLEDLSVNDYKILNKLEPLPVDAIEKVLKAFGALHGLSYVLKKRDRKLFDSLSGEVNSVWVEIDETFAATMAIVETDITKLLDCEEYKEKAKGLMVNQTKLTNKLEAEDIEKSDCTVILHCDAWTNNLMFKYEDGNISSLIMIDYQLSHQGNPVLDLVYMIFSCTDYDMRSKHFHHWLDLYHEELTRITNLFDVDVNKYLSREDLDRQLKRYAKSALGIAFFFNTFVLKESDEVFDFKNPDLKELKVDDFIEFTKTSRMNERSVLRLKNRVNGLFKSFEELGFLKDDVWNSC